MLRALQAVAKCLLSVALAVQAASAAAAITGVCPDGSVFIVQTRAQIPCAGAKEVEPSQVPPMRPENLPRPYLWEVYRERTDTGRNPYHLLDRADAVRRGTEAAGQPAPQGATASTRGAPLDPQPEAARAGARQPTQLGLSDGEVRDLFFLVELSQQYAPVAFVEGIPGRERLRVSFAHSEAFSERVRQSGLVAPASSSPVLLFSSVAGDAISFHPNFTLVQGHLAFQPDLRDPSQMGLLRGSPGRQEVEGVVLGYLVLPDGFSLDRPLDLYWDDRRIEAAQLRP